MLTELIGNLKGVLFLVVKRDQGFAYLDNSASGFWRSFFAMLFVLPAMIIGRTILAKHPEVFANHESGPNTGLPVYLFFEFLHWVLPIVIVAFAAKAAKMTEFFAGWVVATNWYSVISAYLMLVPLLLIEFSPDMSKNFFSMTLIALLIAIVGLYRVNFMTAGRNAPIGLVLTLGLIAFSVFFQDVQISITQ